MNVTVLLKSKWLCLSLLLVLSFSSYAQQGYYWTFVSSTTSSGAAQFNSTPATSSTSGSQVLTEIGTGDITAGIMENPGILPSCSSPVPVAAFTKEAGLQFANSPQLISSTYTIEIVAKFDEVEQGDFARVMGFYDVNSSDPNEKTYGIYLNDQGQLIYWDGNGNGVIITASPLVWGNWYHLAFTRNSSGEIRYYQNGTPIGSVYNDATGNHFLPHAGGTDNNKISFFADDNGEVASGRIAKISIYDTAFNESTIDGHVAEVCDGIPEMTWNTAGNSGTSLNHFVGTRTNQPLIFKTNNTEALRVTSAGQVLVATQLTPTGYKLAVGGNIIAERVTVKLVSSWADYVFDKNYRLPSLQEIEEYIKKHKHLPGIPSAMEVKEKGIDVGDQQSLLLQKIEELTLHLISMNKQIERLTQENEKLKKDRKPRKRKREK